MELIICYEINIFIIIIQLPIFMKLKIKYLCVHILDTKYFNGFIFAANYRRFTLMIL